MPAVSRTASLAVGAATVGGVFVVPAWPLGVEACGPSVSSTPSPEGSLMDVSLASALRFLFPSRRPRRPVDARPGTVPWIAMCRSRRRLPDDPYRITVTPPTGWTRSCCWLRRRGPRGVPVAELLARPRARAAAGTW